MIFARAQVKKDRDEHKEVTAGYFDETNSQVDPYQEDSSDGSGAFSGGDASSSEEEQEEEEEEEAKKAKKGGRLSYQNSQYHRVFV